MRPVKQNADHWSARIALCLEIFKRMLERQIRKIHAVIRQIMQTLHRIVDTACLPVGIYVAQDVGAHVRQLIEFRIKLPCAAERNERKVIAASALIERSQPWYAIGASKQPHN